MLRSRLRDSSLSSTEAAFIEALTPAFRELEESAGGTLYVEGASRLLRFERMGDISELNSLMEMLERRVSMLSFLRSALGERDVLVRIGTENDVEALRSKRALAAAARDSSRRCRVHRSGRSCVRPHATCAAATAVSPRSRATCVTVEAAA